MNPFIDSDATNSDPSQPFDAAETAPGLLAVPPDWLAATQEMRRRFDQLQADLAAGTADDRDPATIWRAIHFVAAQTNALAAMNLAMIEQTGQVLALVKLGADNTGLVAEGLNAVQEQVDDAGPGWDVGEPTGGYGD